VAESLAAARWLRGQGAQQLYFKVCSTFDSTPQGNIGPVAEALLDELDAGQPALPHFAGSSRRPSRRTAARSSRAISSSATCCCRTARCATTR
jgi:hypothetical protein